MIMSNDENSKQIEPNKRQRKRSVFDLEQIRQLEYVFDQITHYPDLSLRQQLTRLTQLPDKKVQIWFQNRRAKWRKQHHLGHFGGLHELAVDTHLNFVPAPKPNFILTSPSSTVLQDASVQQQQQLGYFFYLALQRALATKSNDNLEQTHLTNAIDPSQFLSDSTCPPNKNH